MQDSTTAAYQDLVELKYQLYNSLFLTLPLDAVEQAALLLPLLEEAGSQGLSDGQSPRQILDSFLDTHRPGRSEREQIQFLFKVIQYVERQVVLVDALEDAAFKEVNRTTVTNKLFDILQRVDSQRLHGRFQQLLQQFGARVVLTAHPTQFYPGPVLGIITDLTDAIRRNDNAEVKDLLQQLGNTPFYMKEKPSPYDEAVQLSWYLPNIFYPVFGEILDALAEFADDPDSIDGDLLGVGFWPGGDRDGNPFVTADITERVSGKLRSSMIACYHQDIRELKRRLSFAGVYEDLSRIEQTFHSELTGEVSRCYESVDEIINCLDTIAERVRDRHQGLFVEQLESFKRKLRIFGFHFASLDLRQDSRVLAKILRDIFAANVELLPEGYAQMSAADRIDSLLGIRGRVELDSLDDELARDTLRSLCLMQEIQRRNGERGCHRYIISNCAGAEDVANLVALFRLAGWQDEPLTVDIVPLFETIDDLRAAGDSMTELYAHESYRAHVRRRRDRQTVMLGFSDGTKDGGYMMANWAIYRAKEDVTAVSREVGVEVAFFDGRGGPPARGGGNTYNFYSALGKRIESNQIQLTVQGQTISSYYGTRDAAHFNISQLLAAGMENNLFERPERELSEEQRELIEQLGVISYDVYMRFKQHPLFLPYLEQMSTLHYYAQTNIGSRPAKRGDASELRFEDLRAIPFVGAWSQLKQNVPGYYGLGSALRAMEEEGRLEACQALYRESRFFAALIENSMQSMSKSNFELTAYMRDDEKFGEFWCLLRDEFELSKEMVLKVSGQKMLLQENPGSRHSIALRQRVVQPLLLIQQYALMRIHELGEASEQDQDLLTVYEKMVMRSLFGNINASRNSA